MNCIRCGSETIRHEAQCDVICEREIQIGEAKIECISPSHASDEIWLICLKCQAYHLQCRKCLLYCRLIEFPRELRNEDCSLNDEIGENLYYFDNSKWYPTGIDGSESSTWKCESCNYEISSYD